MVELHETRTNDTQSPMVANGQGAAEGSKLPQYLVTLAVTLIVVSGGSMIGWSSPALVYLTNNTETFTISDGQSSWVGSLLAVGAFCGALPAGTLADTIGRKYSILSMAVPIFLSWVLIFLANGAVMLYIARIIGGIGLGAICAIVPMYVAEIAENSIRGLLASAFPVMLAFGIQFSWVIGAFFPYRLLTIACSAVPFAFAVAFSLAPESPYHLEQKGEHNKAEMAMKSLKKNIQTAAGELQQMENFLSKQNQKECSNWKLKALVIYLGLIIFQQLSGFYLFLFYLETIFITLGSSFDPKIATLVVAGSQFISIILLPVILNVGRKPLLQFSLLTMALSLFMLDLYLDMKSRGDATEYRWVPLASVCFYVVMYIIGLGSVPFGSLRELVCSDRRLALIVYGTEWGIIFTMTNTFFSALGQLGAAVTFRFLMWSCLAGASFVTLFVFETQGKTRDEILKMMTTRCNK